VGFVVDEAALGQAISEYFGFPCQSFHRLLHIHHHHPSSIIIRGWYNRPMVTSVIVDSVSLHPKEEKNFWLRAMLGLSLTEFIAPNKYLNSYTWYSPLKTGKEIPSPSPC
jgi:hypothetical protein